MILLLQLLLAATLTKSTLVHVAALLMTYNIMSNNKYACPHLRIKPLPVF